MFPIGFVIIIFLKLTLWQAIFLFEYKKNYYESESRRDLMLWQADIIADVKFLATNKGVIP